MDQLEGTEGRRIKDSIGQHVDAAKLNEIWAKYFSQRLEPYRPSISKLVDHIDYIVKLVGDDYVGIGSDLMVFLLCLLEWMMSQNTPS
jgi:microsomal dipeptidase-like Zn-dependent dipeptidase